MTRRRSKREIERAVDELDGDTVSQQFDREDLELRPEQKERLAEVFDVGDVYGGESADRLKDLHAKYRGEAL